MGGSHPIAGSLPLIGLAIGVPSDTAAVPADIGAAAASISGLDVVPSLWLPAAAERGTVLIDSNAVAGLAKDATLGGRIAAGERGVVSYVTGPELRNAAARSGGKFFVPGALKGLPVLEGRPSLDLIINLRGQMARALGKVGDGIIGAQAVESGIPLVTNDTELARIVLANGGVVR